MLTSLILPLFSAMHMTVYGGSFWSFLSESILTAVNQTSTMIDSQGHTYLKENGDTYSIGDVKYHRNIYVDPKYNITTGFYVSEETSQEDYPRKFYYRLISGVDHLLFFAHELNQSYVSYNGYASGIPDDHFRKKTIKSDTVRFTGELPKFYIDTKKAKPARKEKPNIPYHQYHLIKYKKTGELESFVKEIENQKFIPFNINSKQPVDFRQEFLKGDYQKRIKTMFSIIHRNLPKEEVVKVIYYMENALLPITYYISKTIMQDEDEIHANVKEVKMQEVFVQGELQIGYNITKNMGPRFKASKRKTNHWGGRGKK